MMRNTLEGRAPSRPSFGGVVWAGGHEGPWPSNCFAAMTEHGPPRDAAWGGCHSNVEGRAPSRPSFGGVVWACGHEGPWPSNCFAAMTEHGPPRDAAWGGCHFNVEGRAPSKTRIEPGLLCDQRCGS